MKNLFLILTVCTLVLATSCNSPKTEWIRINQLGYRTNDIKVAVFLSKETVTVSSFTLLDAVSGKTVMTFDNPTATDPLAPFASCYRLPFTKYTKPGTYRIVAGKTISPDFRIGDDVYDGTADFLLNYMRQQRCGYNPYLKDSCHMADGYEIYGPSKMVILLILMPLVDGMMLLIICSMLPPLPMPLTRCFLLIRRILDHSLINTLQTDFRDLMDYPMFLTKSNGVLTGS